MAQMWAIAYGYLKMTGREGLAPRKPPPPSVFTDHSFPTPPGGGGGGVDDDPSRGASVDDDDSFTLLDLLLALFAWVVYLAEVIVWLVTVLPGLILDVATFPAREVICWTVVVPAWDLYMLSRRALVMSGFLMPKPEEIDLGLTTLGTSGGFSIASALDDPFGIGATAFVIDEPSGRLTHFSSTGLDPAYPRNIVRDHPADVSRPDLVSALGLTGPLAYEGDGGEFKPSEWVAPWRYPFKNQAGNWVPQEGAPAHVGPYVVGDRSTVLLPGPAGDDGARTDLEKASNPEETFTALNTHLAGDRHLGGPVDYSVYLIGRMAGEHGPGGFGVPDFNLDSDRGYAWHCWDWDRHNLGRSPVFPDERGRWECEPDFTATPQTNFRYAQPCTVPQLFHIEDNPERTDSAGIHLVPHHYDPMIDFKVHYLDRNPAPPPERFGDDPCDEKPPHEHDLRFGTDWRWQTHGRHGGQG